jgi:hypothetical protein
MSNPSLLERVEALALLAHNLRGAAKIEEAACRSSLEAIGFRTDDVDHMSTNAALLKQAAGAVDALAALQSEADRLRANGEFLLDRLSQFEGDCEFNDETYREWGGHVVPAIERFRAALSATQQEQTTREEVERMISGLDNSDAPVFPIIQKIGNMASDAQARDMLLALDIRLRVLRRHEQCATQQDASPVQPAQKTE